MKKNYTPIAVFSQLKKFLVLAIFATVFFSAKGQYVNIPDGQFRVWLLNHGYSSCMSGTMLDTTCTLVINATKINCSNSGISDLTGIEFFKSLDTLQCQDNHLLSLSNLPASLIYLDCSSSQFPMTLTTLSNLPPSLLYLNCSNDFTTSSLANLSGLPSLLIYLNCEGNNLSSLPNLPSTITYMNCSGNPLISLPALPTSLQSLWSNNCNLSSLPALPLFLTELHCTNNQLNSLPILPSSLSILDCIHNQLSTLPTLSISLSVLDCAYNMLVSIPALPNQLNILWCDSNQLTSLPILPAGLNELYCNTNYLTALPSLPDSLFYLDCEINQLTSLPHLPSVLTLLWCNDNQITSISNFPDTLWEGNISNNPIVCLPQLKYIDAFYWSNTNIHCLPNYGNILNPIPLLTTVPLCQPSNQCPAFWNITGEIFLDENGNCVRDTNESLLKNVPVTLDSGNVRLQTFLTNSNGVYAFTTGPGTYTLQIDTANLPFNVVCPASFYHTSVLNQVNDFDSLVNFGVQCKPGFDMQARSISPNIPFRVGRERTLYSFVGDAALFFETNCTNTSGTVQIILSDQVSYVSPASGAITPSLINGDTITWNVNDFSTVNSATDFNIIVLVSMSAIVHDTICFQLNVSPTTGDYDPSNNSYTACFPIVGSYDPNEKYMSPSGVVDTSQQWFTFTIFFQNTGNAPAEEIYILDTLSNNLDATTFTYLSSSHYVITQMLPGNILRFNYPAVNLPDSTSNEMGSHGYVQFKIKRKTGLPFGASILNTAYIYFDFNAAVVTNQTSATLSLLTGIQEVNPIQFEVYPNPTSGSFTIQINQLLNSTNAEAIFYDMLGKEVLNRKLHSSKTEIAQGLLERGVYFVKVRSEKAELVKKLVIE